MLTHIFSHLPPQSLVSIALVSRWFHSLITTPHAWRIAFARYFPGSTGNIKATSLPNEDDSIAEKRYFNRLSTLASWRSEYILRTRLLRALNRGRPGEPIAAKSRSSNSNVSQVNYFSSINLSVTHIDALLSNNPNRPPPKFIHGAEQFGIVTASEPGIGKADNWGFRDMFSLNEFSDLFPSEAEYGLGRGQVVGVPNSLAISRRYGMVCGEGIPGGRLYYRSIEEQRGRLLMMSRPVSNLEMGIPMLDPVLETICTVWISRTPNIPDLSDGLVGILSGSSLGVITAYSLGTNPTAGKRLDRGEMTARWIVSPGVPIICLSVDLQYSRSRYRGRRIWAVALNALGEVFYATEMPTRAIVKDAVPLTEDATYELAWQTGRSITWSLVEPTRRTARVDLYEISSFDGSYSPRGSSNSIGLNKDQVSAETKEIEQYVKRPPNHFQSSCENWDMKRRIEVDFAGCNENKAGESIVVFECGLDESQKSRIRRFTRFRQEQSITPHASTSQSPVIEPASSVLAHRTLAYDVSWSFESTPSRRSSATSSTASLSEYFETWRVSELSFAGLKNPQISTTALDCSKFALLTLSEDPLLTMSASTDTSPMASPVGNLPLPIKATEVPGQRSRLVAVGTMVGSVFIWNLRAATSTSSEIVNTIEPLRVIYTDSPQISCLALTALYLVHGGNDGLVQAWDPLASSSQPTRTINSRFSSRARRRIAQAEASPWGVGINLFAAGALWLDPDPTVLRGMVSLGGHLRYWSYSSQSADQYKSSKRRLRRSERGSNHSGERLSYTGRGNARSHIAHEQLELEKEDADRKKEESRLAARFGTGLLGPGATEDEVMAYAAMLSEEAAKADEAKRGIAVEQSPKLLDIAHSSHNTMPNAEDDADLAAAIQASLNQGDSLSDEPSATASSQGFTVRYVKNQRAHSPPVPGSSTQPEMDDLEFALQLSIAEEASRLTADTEDFPALTSINMSPEAGNGNGKGKERRRS